MWFEKQKLISTKWLLFIENIPTHKNFVNQVCCIMHITARKRQTKQYHRPYLNGNQKGESNKEKQRKKRTTITAYTQVAAAEIKTTTKRKERRKKNTKPFTWNSGLHTRYIERRAVCTYTHREREQSPAQHSTAINTNKYVEIKRIYKMRHYSDTAHMRNSIAKPTFKQWKTKCFFTHKFNQLIENYDVNI